MAHHIWHVGRMGFVLHETNLAFFFGGGGYLVYHFLKFLFSPSVRILLAGILNLNLINYSNKYYCNFNSTHLSMPSKIVLL